MPSELAEQVANHLRFFGSKVSPSESDKEALLVEHPERRTFLLKESHGIVRFILYYWGKEGGKVNPPGYLELLNSLNRKASVARFCKIDDNTLLCQAFFHGVYDKPSFGFFLELWERDTGKQLNDVHDELCKYVD